MSLICYFYLSFQRRDTFWIETLNLVMLIYAQKRIHFSRADSYKMRIQLAILDWVKFKNTIK